MKKLMLAVCVMLSVVSVSYGGVKYNFTGKINMPPFAMYFTIESDGEYGLVFGSRTDSLSSSDIQAFGYYFTDDPTTLISGTLTGNNSDYFNSLGNVAGTGLLIDTNTGYLGEFKAGDTIAIWIQGSIDGYIRTNTFTWDMKDGVFTCLSGWGYYFQFVELGAPSSGEPLPGVMAALTIGGCAFLGKKIRKSTKK